MLISPGCHTQIGYLIPSNGSYNKNLSTNISIKKLDVWFRVYWFYKKLLILSQLPSINFCTVALSKKTILKFNFSKTHNQNNQFYKNIYYKKELKNYISFWKNFKNYFSKKQIFENASITFGKQSFLAKSNCIFLQDFSQLKWYFLSKFQTINSKVKIES